MSEKQYLNCSMIAKLMPELKIDCCGSCHEDYEECGYNLLNLETEKADCYVCCSMVTALEKDDLTAKLDGRILK